MLAAMTDYPAVDAAGGAGAGEDADMADAAGGASPRPGWRAAAGQGAASDDGGAAARWQRSGGSDEDGGGVTAGAGMRRLRSISAPGLPQAAVPAGAKQQQQQQQEQERGSAPDAPASFLPRAGELHLPLPSWGLPAGVAERAARSTGGQVDWRAPPELLVEEPGLCCWQRLDTSFGLPKVRGWRGRRRRGGVP
jgi:hypothetical protein